MLSAMGFAGFSAVLGMLDGMRPTTEICEAAQEFVELGVASEYARLGDCYLYGSLGKKNSQRAKTLYLKAVLGSDSPYAKLQLGRVFAADSKSEFWTLLGRFFLEEVANDDETPYQRDALYALGVLNLEMNDLIRAKQLLAGAALKGSLSGLYALNYLGLKTETETIEQVRENLQMLEASLAGGGKSVGSVTLHFPAGSPFKRKQFFRSLLMKPLMPKFTRLSVIA